MYPDRPTVTDEIGLRFTSTVERVSLIRRFVEQFYAPVLLDADVLSRITVVIHELLENAAKYSLDGVGELKVTVSMEDRQLRIAATNRAHPGRIAELEALFDEMRTFTDPFEYYLSAIRRSSVDAENSRLGLARICAEGEMTLSMNVEDDVVSLEATAGIGQVAP